MIRKQIEHLYVSYTGIHPEHIEELPLSGSNRNYFRLTGSENVIGAYGCNTDENKAFIYLSSFFRKNGLHVPEVLIYSEDSTCYLQQDLGNTPLFDLISEGRTSGKFNSGEKALLKKTMSALAGIQLAGTKGLDYTQCYPQAEFNTRSVFWDLNYFKYYFLKPSGLEFQEDKLEDDFEAFAHLLTSEPFDTFMYRDFQSRNVMIIGNEPWFIDFQGGRKGPVYYDVASFLWQARAGFPPELRKELINDYLDTLSTYRQIDKGHFMEMLRHFVLFRTLQVLGAYGFRGYFEQKPHFIASIPFALRNLNELLKEGFVEYPYLISILNELSELKREV